MRIAIISDIHGNLEALNATIKDIEKKNVDKIFCLGDTIGKGIHPTECLKIVREKCEVILKGNNDRFFSEEHNESEQISEINKKRIVWNNSLISKSDKEFLRKLPFSYEFYMSGSLIRIFHATPKRDNFAIINENSAQVKYEMFMPTEKTLSQEKADVVIYGHIHHPYMDKIYNRTLINIGSVGNSFDLIRNREKDASMLETTKAFYLIIEGEYGSKEYDSDISFQFVKVPYDIGKELSENEENIELEDYKSELLEGRYRDMKKIYDSFKEIGIDFDKF